MNVDVSKAPPKEITFSKEGNEFTVEFHYPWLPSRCNLCDIWGHAKKVCVMNGKEKKQEGFCSIREEEVKVQETGIEEIEKEEGVSVLNLVEVNEQKERIEEKNTGKELSQEVATNKWSFVSPIKAGEITIKLATEERS